MKKELTKVNPSEFGLEEKTAKEIESHFAPAIIERDALVDVYANLITGELTPELCVNAKELRNKLVKVRTHIGRIHRVEKAFYLAGGKFVDAWKNKNTAPVEEMESKLMEIEKHFEKIEAERIAKLGQERRALLLPLVENELIIPAELGYMEELIWDSYLTGQKVAFEARREAEKKAEEARKEAERLKKLKAERELQLRPYFNFLPEEHPSWETLLDSEWIDFVAEIMSAKETYDTEQENIRIENERLKKEAEEKERKAEAERKEREEKERKEKAVFEAKLKAEREAREKVEREERATREKLQAELKAKEDTERKEKARLAQIEADEKEVKRLESLAPEKEKMQSWIDSIELPDINIYGFSSQGISVIDVITQKFTAFKAWADAQKESIK